MSKKKTAPAQYKVKSVRKPLFMDLAPDKYFVLCNGSIIKNYKELAAMLETVGDDVFYYHVTGEKNDFASWINDVFEEHELAEEIRKSRSRHEMMAMIYRHLFCKLEAMLPIE